MPTALAAVFLFVMLAALPVGAQLTARSDWTISHFPLSQFRIEMYRGMATTIGGYRLVRPEAVQVLSTGYSDRLGAPTDLFQFHGHVHLGITRKRGIFQIDRTGRRVAIDYRLLPWAYHAFQAGPVLIRWTANGRSGVYIAAKEERFEHRFVTGRERRMLSCLDETGQQLSVYIFTGSLWWMAPVMLENRHDRCLNHDGGRQSTDWAINPAVVGIIPECVLAGREPGCN
jgi:hypothetical protein